MKINRILLLSFCFISISSFAQKANIALNLKKGKEYKQHSVYAMKINQNMGGQQVDMDINLDNKMSFLVTDIQNNVFSMDVKYESMTMEMKMPQMDMTYSSENGEDADMMSQVLASMKGKAFNIKMDKTGHIKEVSNMDNVFSAVDGFDQIPAEQKDQIKDQLKKSFGEESLTNSMESLFAIFPTKKVAPGDTWNVTSEVETMMELSLNGTYKYEKATGEDYIISGNTKIKSGSEPTNVNGMQMTYDMSGTMLSDIKVNKKSGWISEANLTQELSGTASAGGMQIPMSTKSTIKITD
ncbi:DUF6263 family protein [Fulvivirga sediminis]|uniref:DUF4412 domain-containing protein n=1 Tax=Fulvivirga sediminis TaxID=2803949 RepID=A0A937FBD3_9BACT|nr:DUF6263 family protein [Fulvivirga sediminis]MBL3658064.1 hypothetical protein [Fulvivirga sediminis]